MLKPAFVFLFALSGICNAQTSLERPASLAIGYGVAVPFGKFESTDVNDSASGYSTAGTCLNVSFVYLLNNNIGVAAMINSTANRLNTEGVKNKFRQYLDEHIPGAVISDIRFEKWKTMAYMAGIYIRQPLQRASLNLKFLVGYSRTKYPETDVTVFKDTSFDAISVIQSSDEVISAFCFTLGAGLRYDISDIMCLCVNADFFSTYPEFKEVVTTSTFQGNTPDEIHSVRQRVSLLNITAGVGFRF